MISPIPTAQQARRLRTVLVLLLGLALISALLLWSLLVPRMGTNIIRLELTTSAAEFKAVLLQDWVQDAHSAGTPDKPLSPVCGIGLPHVVGGTDKASFGKLRCNLFVDSLGLVPGYAGLLVYFTLAFAPIALSTVRRHLWCGPALAAGLFDIAENGMTARALDDLIFFSLADATVADVRHASQAKWLLLALALTVLAYRTWRAGGAGETTWRRVSAVLLAAAAPALVLGAYGLQHVAITAGMGALVLALALLCCRQWMLTACLDGRQIDPPAPNLPTNG